MRYIHVPLNDLLDLVLAADSFGFDDDVFFDAMAEWTGSVTDAEIGAFAESILENDGYDEDDRDNAIDRLTEWRDRYCKPREAR